MGTADAADQIASIVMGTRGPDVVATLSRANAFFRDPGFEAALAQVLRDQPVLVERWQSYSRDQRWTPAAYVEGTETGWYDHGRHDVVRHVDHAAAVADFIHRTAAHLDRRA